MKRLFCCIGLILIIAACSKVEEGNENSTQKPETPKGEIKIDDTSADFTSEGGSEVVTFKSSGAWTAEVINSRADSWCSVNPTSGAAGDAKVTVTTKANDTPDDRTASIIIKTGTASRAINVSQKQKDALTVTASKFEVGSEGGEITIEAKANIDFEYEIEGSAQEWISYQTTRALKTSSLVFNVAANESTEKREGKIVIRSGEFNETVSIYQNGSNPCIVLTQNEYIVPYEGGSLSVEVKSNVDVTMEISEGTDWVSENTTRALSTNTYNFNISMNDSYDNRSAEIRFTNKENNISEIVCITQMQRNEILVTDSEHEISSKGGILEFEIQSNVDYEVTVSDNAKYWIQQVETRGLESQTLYFSIGENSSHEIREGTITISYGTIAKSIKVKQLGTTDALDAERALLIEFYKATNGDNWVKNTNWCSDKPVKEWYGITTDSKGFVYSILLENNNLVGEIRRELGRLSHLRNLKCSSNQLVSLDVSDCTNLAYLVCSHNLLKELDVTNLKDLETLSCGNNMLEKLDVSNLTKLTWLNCGYNKIIELDVSNCPDLEYLYAAGIPNLTITITREQDFDYSISGNSRFIYKGESNDIYVSVDYSQDGITRQLQKASIGDGIDIVLMGDGYTDRLIADGTYDKTMRIAMEKFFTEEPYKSFRDYFNVHTVNVVSPNEIYTDESTTALECWFGEGTNVGGNDNKAFTYSLKAIDEDRMDEAIIIVIMNSSSHAGTCWIYSTTYGDWGNGVSVSYFPAGKDAERLARVLHHEACGHGFAKLADEYIDYADAEIPPEDIEARKKNEKYGWWKNIDFTNDPTKVKWSHFLADPRYEQEGLGVFEGALYYGYGAYRPTENSIMRDETSGFNAPSREAIYYRIHKLAYGADWKYDYEEFVKWDEKNRKKEETRGVPYRLDDTEDFQPTHPPVVINKSWRDAR